MLLQIFYSLKFVRDQINSTYTYLGGRERNRNMKHGDGLIHKCRRRRYKQQENTTTLNFIGNIYYATCCWILISELGGLPKG